MLFFTPDSEFRNPGHTCNNTKHLEHISHVRWVNLNHDNPSISLTSQQIILTASRDIPIQANVKMDRC